VGGQGEGSWPWAMCLSQGPPPCLASGSITFVPSFPAQAEEGGPELAAATATQHAHLLLRQGEPAAAAAVLARHAPGADARAVAVCRAVGVEVLGLGHSARDQQAEQDLRWGRGEWQGPERWLPARCGAVCAASLAKARMGSWCPAPSLRTPLQGRPAAAAAAAGAVQRGAQAGATGPRAQPLSAAAPGTMRGAQGTSNLTAAAFPAHPRTWRASPSSSGPPTTRPPPCARAARGCWSWRPGRRRRCCDTPGWCRRTGDAPLLAPKGARAWPVRPGIEGAPCSC
jgi:hypothetical protein